MIDNDNDYDQKNHHDQDNHQKNRHRKKQNKQQPPSVRGDDQDIKLERFMTDMQRYMITISKDEFPKRCIQNLRKHLDTYDHDSDDEETWAPPRPPSSTWTWSSASSARTTSSPFFNNNDDNDDNHDDKSSSLSLHSAIISSTEDDMQDDEDREIIFDAGTDDNNDDNDHHHPSTSTPKTPKYQFQDDELGDVTLIEDKPKTKKSRKTKSKLTSVKKALSPNNSLAELFNHGSPTLRSRGKARQHLDSQSEPSTVESTRRKLRLRAKK